MSKKVLIVSTSYMSLDISSNNRTNFMPQYLHENNFDVTLITSNFNHHKKEHVKEFDKRDYKTIIIEELGYKKNVSFKRIRSIFKFKRNLKKHLKENKEKYDVVIVFTPPLSISSLIIKEGKKQGWKTVLDIRDLWPEVYKLLIPNNVLYKTLFWPLILKANGIYKKADHIIAVSETYRIRSKRELKNSDVIYLGTSFSMVDKIIKETNIKKPKEEVWLTYAGTIGNSYGLDNLLKAYNIVLKKGYENIKLLLIGSGPLKKQLIELDKELNTNVMFFDRMPYDKMISYLSVSDIGVNSLSNNAPQSIINKHMDYSAVGLPVLNTQKLVEYYNMIIKNKIGINVDSDNLDEYANSIINLALDNKLRKELGNNHRKLGEAIFNRDHNYKKLIKIINEL